MGGRARGRQKTTYVDILLKDTGLKTVDEVAIRTWQRHVKKRTSMVAGDLTGVSECVRVQVDVCQRAKFTKG